MLTHIFSFQNAGKSIFENDLKTRGRSEFRWAWRTLSFRVISDLFSKILENVTYIAQISHGNVTSFSDRGLKSNSIMLTEIKRNDY